MKFNEKLKYLRESKSFTQDEIATKLNIARQSVSKWEQGINEPDIETLKKLCIILDCSIGDLIDDDKEVITTKEEKDERKAKWLFLSNLMLIIAGVLMFIAIIVSANDEAIIHYGINGKEYGSKWNLLFSGVVLIILLIVTVAIRLITNKNEQYRKAKLPMQIFSLVMSFALIAVLFVVTFLSTTIDMNNVTGLVISFMYSILCGVGPFTNPKFAKRSVVFGFRTNFTLSNEEGWNRINHFSSIVLTISSAVAYVLTLLFISKVWVMAFVGVIFIALIISGIYHEIVKKDIMNRQ